MKMENFIEFLKNDIVGTWISPIIMYFFGLFTMHIVNFIKDQIAIRRKKNREINVFREYSLQDNFKSVVSYDDPKAIKILPVVEDKDILVKADIDFSRVPKNKFETRK